MPAHKALPIQLLSTHERELTALVRAYSTPRKLAERARIILLAASGLGVDETARKLGIWRKTASTWRRRWQSADATAAVSARLGDAPRSGAPATFTPEVICKIVALSCEDPETLDVPLIPGALDNDPYCLEYVMVRPGRAIALSIALPPMARPGRSMTGI